MAAPQSATTRS